MKINITILVLSVLILLVSSTLSAQDLPRKKKSNLYLNTFIGYGTENNWGNTAFFAGVNLSKPITKHIFLEAGLTRFTTDIYNVYKAKPTGFNGEDRKYNAWFLTPNVNYTFGKKESFVNTSIKIGPSLKYYNFRVLDKFRAYVQTDGSKIAIPGTVSYYDQKGFNISLYSSISFNAKVNNKLRLGVFLDTYSHAIPIEHFMPGINALFKL